MTESRLIPRTAAHVAVTGLVVVSIAIGLAAGPGSPGHGFFDLIAVAQGAAGGDSMLESVGSGSRYELTPAPEDADAPTIDRRVGAFAAEPTPLPTPVAPPAAPSRPVTVFAAPNPNVVGTGELTWPVPGGTITQYYSSAHRALDIAAPYGTRVNASDGGTVTWAGWRDNGGGLVVAINHGNGVVTVYNHLGSILVSAGQVVARGERIAKVGCTGTCTGPHVHYEVIIDGVIVNPLRYL